MIPWAEIDRAEIPGGNGDVTLLKRDAEFSIRIAGTELMNSRRHGSEDALAKFSCNRMKRTSGQKILIGGLGMGYTLAAALARAEPRTQITVVELIPAVVKWNREHLGHLAGMPLEDPRVTVKEEDVAKTIRQGKSIWNAILLDVDNGPDGLARKANNYLYSNAGLNAAFSALCPGGVLSVWSCVSDEAFTHRLKQCGFKTEITSVRAHKPGKGSRHTIWIAEKP